MPLSKRRRIDIDSVRLFHSPLVDHVDFSWYDAPLDTMPEKFALAISDGPRSRSEEKGRRYGLSPIMSRRFMPGGIILDDNVELEHEKESLSHWMKEINLEYEKFGSYRSYYIIRVSQNSW